MRPLIYLYDDSFEGLLTAVAQAVKNPGPVHGIYPANRHISDLFSTVQTIEKDHDQAERLFSYLHRLSPQASRLTVNAFLSEEYQSGAYLYEFVKLSLTAGKAVLNMHPVEAVRNLHALSKKVDSETHRLQGLLRFRVLDNGCHYGPFSSDHNVIGYLAEHFAQRFAGRHWLLHDTGRDFALYWDTQKVQTVTIDGGITAHVARFGELPNEYLSDEENRYQQLWRSFHFTTANPDRENRKLQQHFMPRRYWRFLVEEQQGPDQRKTAGR